MTDQHKKIDVKLKLSCLRKKRQCNGTEKERTRTERETKNPRKDIREY